VLHCSGIQKSARRVCGIMSAKVITLVGPASPYRGGIAHFLETMYSGLAARGHAVDIVTFRRQYPPLLFPGKSQFEPGELAGVPALRLLDSINPLTWWRTGRHIKGRRVDAVVFQYWMPFFAPAFGTLARSVRRSGARIVAVVHNALPHERRLGDRLLSRIFLSACDDLLVMSDAVEQDLRELGIRPAVHRVPHPVYDRFGEGVSAVTAREQLGLPLDAQVLLFFGFVRRYKGLHILLESLPSILERLPNVRLVVAGEFYDDERSYRRQIAQLGVGAHVTIDNRYIGGDEVRYYFSAADLVVQPYIAATQSGVAQVAYQFDRPMVVTDVGGLAEVVPHERAGLVVPPEDPRALSDAVVRFFEEALAEPLRRGVREEKRKYSWDRLHDVLERLL
jgi:D-inositol-3-phosphate glycosyltransferase